jgi:choline-sulfatase
VAPPEFRKRASTLPVDLLDRAVPNLPRSLLARLIRRYHAEVLYTDSQLGELVSAVHERGGAERTLLVVTGDHGEGLGQHRWLEHAVHLYDEQVRVPLLWHWPGTLPAAGRIETPLGLVDVAPTITALVAASWPAASDGRSLAAALRDGREPEARPILGHRRAFEARAEEHPGQKQSLRSGSWKYIRASAGPDELFDLDADPGELHNRVGDEPDRVAELSLLLEHALADLPEIAEPEPLDEEARRKLEALGYLD